MGKPITPNQFALGMLQIHADCDDDLEDAHCRMDDLMCDLLADLGYDEGIEIFKNQRKWYA